MKREIRECKTNENLLESDLSILAYISESFKASLVALQVCIRVDEIL